MSHPNGPYYGHTVDLDSLSRDAGVKFTYDNAHSSEGDGYTEVTGAPAQATTDDESPTYLQDLVEAASAAAQEQARSQARNGKRKIAAAADTGPKAARKTQQKRRKTDDHESDTSVKHEAARTGSPGPVTRPEGIHSSAALFRPPSTAAKKSTRPPMSTMFASFDLDADTFLKLQSDAKAFMLDPAHPDRLDSVGERGKTDSKGVRLGLSKNVEQFLEEGAGERYFGQVTVAGAESNPRPTSPLPPPTAMSKLNTATKAVADTDSDAPVKDPDTTAQTDVATQPVKAEPTTAIEISPRSIWPRDKAQIIKLCMPLLRRVVTNEKQRQYALVSRKGGGGTRSTSVNEPTGAVALSVFFVDSDDMSILRKEVTSTMQGEIDSHSEGEQAGENSAWEQIRRLIDAEAKVQEFKLQTSSGLVAVADSESCRKAVEDILRAPWLERTIRVVVLLGEAGKT